MPVPNVPTPSDMRDFFREMLDRGVFLAPSQFEAAFVSSAHTARILTARWRLQASHFR